MSSRRVLLQERKLLQLQVRQFLQVQERPRELQFLQFQEWPRQRQPRKFLWDKA